MHDLLTQGIIFFNGGRYFEAHEAWEDLWRETTGPDRLFYQGLIQAAVGLHHLTQHNKVGGEAQLVKAIQKLEQYPDVCCEIENGRFLASLRRALVDLKTGNIQI